jgi:hypothetical protein
MSSRFGLVLQRSMVRQFIDGEDRVNSDKTAQPALVPSP